MSPPLTNKSPDNIVFAERILVLPVVAPNIKSVAAPPKRTEVAVVFATLNVVAEVVMSPPLIAMSPGVIILLLISKESEADR
jgi:hypothetical protein